MRAVAVLAALGLCVGVAAAADTNSGMATAKERSFKFIYTASLTDVPTDAKSVRAWIPIPQATQVQTIEEMVLKTAGEYTLFTEPKYGNRYAFIDLTDAADTHIELTFQVVRKFRGTLKDEVPGMTAKELRRWLGPSKHVSINGPIAAEAKKIVGEETEKPAQTKLLYDYIVDSIVYDKSGEGWGRGDSLYACDVRKGNCTDFHSLFIGEARSLGVPTRFIMGFPVPEEIGSGTIEGYHCWAEFHIEETGWVPLDASEAFKHPERREMYYGGLDPNRVQFTKGRDITLKHMQTEPLNYFIYPHVEVDGKVHAGVEKAFAYQDVP